MRPPHFEVKNCIYFVTCRVMSGEWLLNDPEAARIAVEKIRLKQVELRFTLWAYVIMPNHYHLLIEKDDLQSISKIMHHINGSSARAINELLGREERFWQGGFFDFVIYTQDKLVEKLNYIHHNPVKWDLVAEPYEYEFSSAKGYLDTYGECYF